MSSNKVLRIALLLAFVLCPVPAWAHVHLKRSEPASGSRVESPQIIRLWFSERPEVGFTGVSLKDGTGRDFSVGPPQSDSSSPLAVSFAISATLPAGKYTVAWRTVSSDGHPSHGTFSFLVLDVVPAGAGHSTTPADRQARSSTAATSSAERQAEDANGSASVSNSLTRALSFAGILIVIGVIVFNLLVVTRSARIGTELVWRMESRAAVVGLAASVLVIVAAFARISLETRMMRGMPGMQSMTMSDMLMHTRWGFALRLEIIAAFVALMSFAIAIPRIRSAWLIASLSAAVLAVTPALAGHAAASPRFTSLMIATDFLHVLGAASWLGNLACVMLIGVPIILQSGGETRWQSIASLVNTFSPVALASASVVVLSGVIASCVHIERLSSLWETTYGQVLLVKLAIVIATLTVGAYNFRRVQPQLVREEGTTYLRRSTTVELGFGVLILLVTGFLTGISP